MTVYADSSFLTSLYVRDVHSPEALRRMAIKPIVWLTPFNRVELAHSIHLQVFRGRINLSDAVMGWSAFEQDSLAGLWIETELPDPIWDRGIDLARQHVPTLGIRTLDTLHVASALELGARQFWTFDDRQARLADAVGLDTSA